MHGFGWDNKTLSEASLSFLHSFGEAYIVSLAKHLASVFRLPFLTIHGRLSLIALSLDFFDISGTDSLSRFFTRSMCLDRDRTSYPLACDVFLLILSLSLAIEKHGRGKPAHLFLFVVWF